MRSQSTEFLFLCLISPLPVLLLLQLTQLTRIMHTITVVTTAIVIRIIEVFFVTVSPSSWPLCVTSSVFEDAVVLTAGKEVLFLIGGVWGLLVLIVVVAAGCPVVLNINVSSVNKAMISPSRLVGMSHTISVWFAFDGFSCSQFLKGAMSLSHFQGLG